MSATLASSLFLKSTNNSHLEHFLISSPCQECSFPRYSLGLPWPPYVTFNSTSWTSLLGVSPSNLMFKFSSHHDSIKSWLDHQDSALTSHLLLLLWEWVIYHRCGFLTKGQSSVPIFFLSVLLACPFAFCYVMMQHEGPCQMLVPCSCTS
jgi:hypothetical protein